MNSLTELIIARGRADLDRSSIAGRQVLTLLRVVDAMDKLIDEAAEAKVACPSCLEIREWALSGIEELSLKFTAPLNLKPDAIKDSIAASVLAARQGTPEQYASARRQEQMARDSVIARG